MAIVENQILSKVLDENNFTVLNQFNITADDFYNLSDAYKFVREYYQDNGNTPDYRTVVAEYEEFEYYPEIVDSFKYLAKKLKGEYARRQSIEILQNQAGERFNELSGNDFANWLFEESKRIKEIANAETLTGENYATGGKSRWERYEENKDSRTYKFIETPYPSLTEYLGGGFEIGDYVLLQAYTNRGKSWIASHCGVRAWENGHGVMHYSPELSLQQQEQRNDTLLGMFDNTKIKKGKLAEKQEKEYKAFLERGFAEDNENPYLIKTMEHLNKGLSLDVIEADLQANPSLEMVIIDGFNLISHKGRNSNRDNMSNTSRQLRRMFSRHGVVGIIVHQTPTSAEKENSEDDEDGARIVKPPTISDYSETIAVIQDASTVLSYDYHDGLGKILLAKARSPHVNAEVSLHADYNNGRIEERTILDDI